ncbi:MAG: S8 family serine peptidase [Thermomicrobiales bacterium]
MINFWKHCRAALAAVLLFMLLPAFSAVAPVSAAVPSPLQPAGEFQSADVIPDSYIVTLRSNEFGAASVDDVATSLGKKIKIKHAYKSAIHGFSAEMSAADAEKLSSDPRVALVEPNRKVHLDSGVYDIGVDRVNAELNPIAHIDGVDLPRVNVDIAIVDSGVGPNSLLNIAGGHDCSGSGTYSDSPGKIEFYHGTFVAGLAAAKDNGVGPAGVAPGARIWAVRVFDSAGNGYTDDVVCGLDWIRAHGGIEVVNLSLGLECPASYYECSHSALHSAIQQLTSAGVTVVVAAGNSAANAGNFIPAQYSEVITVSALADSDGKPGGFGAPMYDSNSNFDGSDDGVATWSNYGSVVDIAAPGEDLISLGPNGTYQEASGTSFSSPLAAGAAALYVVEHPGSSPSSVRSGLLAQRERVHMPGDRDSVDEGILNASGRNAAGMTLSRVSAQVDMSVTVNLSGFLPSETVKIKFDSKVLATTSVNSSGVGNLAIKVPAGVKGSHFITASSIEFAAQKALSISPRIKLSPTSGIPGSSFGASLRGFAKAQHVTLRWYNGSSYVTLGSVTTSSTGSANVTYSVPTTYRGGHQVVAVPSAGGSVSTSFTVKPRVRLTPSSGASGSSSTVEIKGFVKGETVKVYLVTGTAKKLLRTLTASATNGTASSTVTIPLSATLGSHAISAEGTLGSLATWSFAVTSIGSSAVGPTATAMPAETATATPVTTASPTEEPSATPAETATPEATSTVVPTDTPTEAATTAPTSETSVADPSQTPTP